jgi:hypothetical protein
LSRCATWHFGHLWCGMLRCNRGPWLCMPAMRCSRRKSQRCRGVSSHDGPFAAAKASADSTLAQQAILHPRLHAPIGTRVTRRPGFCRWRGHGTSSSAPASPRRGRRVEAGLGRQRGGRADVEGRDRSEHLREDEGRDVDRTNAREGVGEGAGDRHGGVGEGRRSRKPVRRRWALPCAADQKLQEISDHAAALPVLNPREPDGIIGYDEHGLPR